MNNSRFPATTLLLLLSLAGCGQKGPLYLPGDPSEVQTEIPDIDSEQLPVEPENDGADNDA